MTSNFKFDLIRQHNLWVPQTFQYYKIFCLRTPWTLHLQFKGFWVISPERFGHTKKLFQEKWWYIGGTYSIPHTYGIM